MDIQTILNNAMEAERARKMLSSEQLTLGELILKLEAIQNKELPIFFDRTRHKPTCVGSWRGSYCELYIGYKGHGEGYNSDEVEWESDDGEFKTYKQIPTTLPETPTAKELLDMLKKCLGKTFVGYKGGDSLMGKTVPVWVSSYGNSEGYKSNKDYDPQAIVDIKELPRKVSIITKLMKY